METEKEWPQWRATKEGHKGEPERQSRKGEPILRATKEIQQSEPGKKLEMIARMDFPERNVKKDT